jgi:purine-binding chemotaxis protein CheW
MSVQLATFTLAGHTYGVAVERVREVLKALPVTPIPLAPRAVAGLMNLRGEVVPVVDLRARLALPARRRDDPAMNVVVSAAGEPVSLLVDQIGDVLDVADEQFETPPDTLGQPTRGLVTGVYKLPDRLLMLVDVDRAVAV